MHLRSTGVATTGGVHLQFHVENPVVHGHCLGVILHQPLGVMERSHATVRRGLHVVESAMEMTAMKHGELAAHRQLVLGVAQERVHERLEVRLADEGGLVTGVVESRGHAWRVDGQGDAVHPHAVGRHVLSGDHRRA